MKQSKISPLRPCEILFMESWQSTIQNLALKIPLFESFKRSIMDCHSPKGLRNDAVANALVFRHCERSAAIHNPALARFHSGSCDSWQSILPHTFSIVTRHCERSAAIHNPAHLHCTTTFAKTAKNP